MTLSRWRRKPVTIDARQLTSRHEQQFILSWIRHCRGKAQVAGKEGMNIDITVWTAGGPVTATRGDWVIRGVHGEFTICQPAIFAATYEPIT